MRKENRARHERRGILGLFLHQRPSRYEATGAGDMESFLRCKSVLSYGAPQPY